MKVVMDDGSEDEFGPGDALIIPSGHNAMVVGDDPVVAIDFTGLLESNTLKHSPPIQSNQSKLSINLMPINKSIVTNADVPVNITLAGQDKQNKTEANLTAHVMSPPSNGRLGPIDQKQAL